MTSREIPSVQGMLDVTESGGSHHHRVGVHRRTVQIGLLAALVSLPLTMLGHNASASAAQSGGELQVWVTQNATATSPIIVTGAIGDYGTATSQDKDGKVDANGDYTKVVLQQGGFTINAVAFNKVLTRATPQVSKTNCGEVFAASGPVSVSGGTGSYVGIKGSITAKLTFVFVNPKLANGKCNLSENANPASAYGTITGSGHVSF